MPASPRRLARTLLSLVALVLLVAPAVLAVATGWIEINFTAWGEQPGPDPTPIESWVALALVYLVWAPVVFVGLVAAFDHLGYKYTPVERDQRPTRRERRRQRAGLRLLQSREAPPAGAPKARPKDGASGSSRGSSASGGSAPPGDGG